jgi:putative tricarboxylic transport membrane protein
VSSPSPGTPTSGRTKRPVAMTVYGIAAAALISTASFLSIQSANAGTDLHSNLVLIAPGGAGGGYDTLAREQQQAMRSNDLVTNSQVINIPGAGGTIGLGQLTTLDGHANTLMVTGSVMLGGIELNDSPVDLSDVRPVARMAEEYDVLIVPADSPYNSLEELIADWKKDPKAFPFTGGSPGSIDHLIIADLALKAGIDPQDLAYIPKTSGGESIQAVASGTAKAAVSGYVEFADQIEAGRMKALGLAAPERFEGVDIPTFAEQGYPTELTNWRGVVAAPGISDEEYAELEQLIAEVVKTPEWAETLELNQWKDVYLSGDEFEKFIEEDQAKIKALIEEVDL